MPKKRMMPRKPPNKALQGTALRAVDGRVFIGDLDRLVWVDEEFHPLRFYEPIGWSAPVALYLPSTEEFVTASFTDVSLTKVAVPR